MVYTTKPGFTFIEIIIVLVIIGILSSIVIPNLQQRRSGYERRQFISNVAALVRRAWQEAIETQRLHRLTFYIDKRTVQISAAAKAGKEEKFENLSSSFIPASYTWGSTLTIKDFFIDGTDAINQPGLRIQEIWFFVFPDGTVQDVIINLFDTSDRTESEAGSRFSLILNPFTTQFSVYETFQHP